MFSLLWTVCRTTDGTLSRPLQTLNKSRYASDIAALRYANTNAVTLRERLDEMPSSSIRILFCQYELEAPPLILFICLVLLLAYILAYLVVSSVTLTPVVVDLVLQS